MILAGLEEFGGTEWFFEAGVGIEGDCELSEPIQRWGGNTLLSLFVTIEERGLGENILDDPVQDLGRVAESAFASGSAPASGPAQIIKPTSAHAPLIPFPPRNRRQKADILAN